MSTYTLLQYYVGYLWILFSTCNTGCGASSFLGGEEFSTSIRDRRQSCIMMNLGSYWFVGLISVQKTKNDWGIDALIIYHLQTVWMTVSLYLRESEVISRLAGSGPRWVIASGIAKLLFIIKTSNLYFIPTNCNIISY